MPWTTPSLDDVRKQNRDYITARLHSAAMVPNSVLRVLSDGNAGLAFLVLLYIDWLALQLLPDTAETEWLDRHAAIWLPAAGRKPATFASGIGHRDRHRRLDRAASDAIDRRDRRALRDDWSKSPSTPWRRRSTIRAVDPGIAGNLDEGSSLAFVNAIAGVDGGVTVVADGRRRRRRKRRRAARARA